MQEFYYKNFLEVCEYIVYSHQAKKIFVLIQDPCNSSLVAITGVLYKIKFKMNITFLTMNMLDPTKCYVGITSTNNRNYMGSGNAIKKAFKEIGKRNFKRIDLGVFETIQEAHYWEGFYIRTLKTLVEDGGYNISPTGGTYNGKHSEETCKKLRGKKRSKEVRKQMSESQRGKNNPMFGKHHKEESKQKCSKSMSGHIVSILTRKKIGKSNIGKNINKKILIKCPYCGKQGGYAIMHRWHFNRCKLK